MRHLVPRARGSPARSCKCRPLTRENRTGGTHYGTGCTSPSSHRRLVLPRGGALQREDERPQQRAARLPTCSALGAFHRTTTHGQDGGDAAAEARLAEAEERRGRPHARVPGPARATRWWGLVGGARLRVGKGVRPRRAGLRGGGGHECGGRRADAEARRGGGVACG